MIQSTIFLVPSSVFYFNIYVRSLNQIILYWSPAVCGSSYTLILNNNVIASTNQLYDNYITQIKENDFYEFRVNSTDFNGNINSSEIYGYYFIGMFMTCIIIYIITVNLCRI